jgi:hypothetical protein
MPNFQNPTLAGKAGGICCTEKPVTKAENVNSFLVVQARLNSLQGYTAIPNFLLDRLRGVLKRNEYDVFMYIVRRTLGFQKLSDAISMSQFQNGIVRLDGSRLDYGCGIKSADTIGRALKELERLGFVSRQHKVAYNGANCSNVFTLHPEIILKALNNDGDDFGSELVRETTGVPEVEKGKEEQKIQVETSENILGEAYPNGGEGVTDLGGDKIQDSQKQFTKTEPMGGVNPVNSDSRTSMDAGLLNGMGFEPNQALRLALIAQEYNKPVNYVTDVVGYSRKNGTTNPAGLARWLIEHGENRPTSILKAELNSALLPPAKQKRPNLSRFIPNDRPINPVSSTLECKEVWETVCRTVRLKLGKAGLAQSLTGMQLLKLEGQSDKITAWIKPEQAWQTRLISGENIALLELVLRQKCGTPCEVRFME